MNNLTLLSFYTPDYQPLADITLPNKIDYCKKWGYTHLTQLFPYKSPTAYYAFDRLFFVRDYLFNSENNCDIIWVLNVHTMIMNYNIKVEDFLDNEHDFYICKDVNGINAGSFIIKKSEWSKKWLDFILSKESTHKNHCWYEQKIIQDNYELPEFKEKIKILSHPSINSYYYDLYKWPDTTSGNFEKGDFVLHLPGLNMNQRIDIFQSERTKNNLIV